MSGAAFWLNRDWHLDGHLHERDESGFCGTCGARSDEAHYRCIPMTPQTRIEWTGGIQVHQPVKPRPVSK